MCRHKRDDDEYRDTSWVARRCPGLNNSPAPSRPPASPLALPLFSPPYSPTSPCRSTQHDLSRPAPAPPPAPPPPRAPLQFLTHPRPVPGRPRPTCKVSALYLENCVSALQRRHLGGLGGRRPPPPPPPRRKKKKRKKRKKKEKKREKKRKRKKGTMNDVEFLHIKVLFFPIFQ